MKIDEINPANTALFLPPASASGITKELTNIEDGALNAIQNEVVGEITMSELEQEMIERVLEKFKGNRRKTAQALDISERTLYRKINDYGIHKKIKSND